MTDDLRDKSDRAKPKGRVRRFLKVLGPGLITGASDDDPSGIGTYAMAGAAFGYSTLWTALVTFPLMASVQYICAKIGLVYGCGIAAIMRREYPSSVSYPAVAALVIANTINAAADIMAIAAGVNLLLPISATVLILPICILILVVQVWGSYKQIEKVFKWLTLALFAYIGSAILAKPDWREVAKGALIPTVALNNDYLAVLVAILGTTISPYLFFWQATHEVEEAESEGDAEIAKKGVASDETLKDAAIDVNAGMLLSNVVMFFIILATGATLHQSGHTEVATATDAAEALKPLAGQAAFLLMALGLIGSGLLAVPILTASGAFAVAELFGWKCGLDEKPGRAKEFYLVIAATMVVAMLISFSGVSPMSALFWTAVINGFLAPPMLLLVMQISNNPKVMGKRVNGKLLNIAGWFTTLLMFVAAVALVITSIKS